MVVRARQQLDFQFAKSERERRKRDKRARKLAKKLCPMIIHLEREFGDAPAADVAELLMTEFNLGKAEVEFGSGRKMNVEQILGVVSDHTVSARLISPIKFWGGPPNTEARRFTGSLLTMLFDRIMYLNAIDGSYAELVGKR